MYKRIQIQEYGEPVIIQTNDIDTHKLFEASNRWKKILGLSNEPFRIEDIGNGQIKLRAEAITGVVRIGNTDIEIAPKFLDVTRGNWQGVLWRILAAVEGGYIDGNLTSANHEVTLAIPDLLAEIFLASYARGASRGLPRSYITDQSQGTSIRGTFDVSRIREWVSRPWVVPYTTDYFSDDTPIAQLLRWTAICLASTVKLPSRAKALRDIAASLVGVSMRAPHLLEARRTRLGIQHKGLEAARMVGILLLEGTGVNHASGDYSLSGFLWNSDTIYENYIFWLCQRVANQESVFVSKSEIRFGQVLRGKGSNLTTTPDVVFRDERGNPIAVVDAKYKRLASRPKASDIYQIFTAGHIIGCQKVSLTYPSSNERELVVWRIPSALSGDDVVLTALPMNLMDISTPDGEKVLIRSISSWLQSD